MENQIYFHIYTSTAAANFSPDDLVQLLTKAREKNSQVGVTGLLVHKDGRFMQLLEGPREAVEKVWARIQADSRHAKLTVLLDGFTKERQFSEWSMGFRDLNSAEARSIHGYSDFLNTPLDGTEFKTSPSRGQRLLLSFKKSSEECES